MKHVQMIGVVFLEFVVKEAFYRYCIELFGIDASSVINDAHERSTSMTVILAVEALR